MPVWAAAVAAGEHGDGAPYWMLSDQAVKVVRSGGAMWRRWHLCNAISKGVGFNPRTYRSLNRRYRRDIGASTATARKNGLLSKLSSVASSWISVSTQCSRHRFVTKSISESMSGKVRPRVPFSSVTVGRNRSISSGLFDGSAALDGRWRRRNWWSWTRYSATECLPAQMPVA